MSTENILDQNGNGLVTTLENNGRTTVTKEYKNYQLIKKTTELKNSTHVNGPALLSEVNIKNFDNNGNLILSEEMGVALNGSVEINKKTSFDPLSGKPTRSIILAKNKEDKDNIISVEVYKADGSSVLYGMIVDPIGRENIALKTAMRISHFDSNRALHCETGPAVVTLNNNNHVLSENMTTIDFDKTEVKKEQYFLHGVLCSDKTFENLQKLDHEKVAENTNTVQLSK